MPDQNPERKIRSDARETMEKIDLSTSCLNCNERFTEKLAWFEKNKFICPACGGSLDPEPARQLLKDTLQRINRALSKPEDSV